MSSEIVIKFLVAAVLAGTPFLFGTVGEILSEKVGHLNLGVEGMMSIGACAGFMVGYQTDNFVAALLAAAVAGMLSALIYGVLTVTFMANQNVTGLTLTIFGVGLANFIGVFMLEKGSSVVQSSFGLSSDCADVLQGIILFFILGCELFIRYQFVFRGKGGTRA